ncbi:MAG: deoxyribodipyrimidine photolyase [Rubrivivax sp.]|nr:deoxyribodipyrimidine photolyase [Rubrivivax sp.]
MNGDRPEVFAPTTEAAAARLAAVRPEVYARTRNHLDGAVTRLSPYLTHGLLTLPQALRAVTAAGPLLVQHKLVREFGWRECFRHVWQFEADGITRSLHPGPLPDEAYARELPADLREARTGVPVVDAAVRTLYRQGWLHNHARLWLASYTVHLRRVHWCTGADWMIGHLLDGDLASNHLSWQWVAGTASARPYLFDAANVARFAPPAWHSPGGVLDHARDELERFARGAALPAPRPQGAGIAEPATAALPPAAPGFGLPDPARLRGQAVWVVHPWSLAGPPAGFAGTVVAVLPLEPLRTHPWSVLRWRFVGERMAALTPLRWAGDTPALLAALRDAATLDGVRDPHLPPALAARLPRPAPRLFPELPQRCGSFSQWWTRATRGLADSGALLAQAVDAP